MMKRELVMVAIVSTLSVLPACRNTGTMTGSSNKDRAPRATPDQFAAARANYEKNCKTCHGANGEGGPVKLEDGTKLKVPTFRAGHAMRHPDSDFVKQITKGGDGMPAFDKKLSSAEIDELVRFIRHEFQGK